MSSEASLSAADWPRVALSDLVDARGVTYGVVQPGQPCADGVPILRVNNFTPNGLRTDDVLRIEPSIADRYQRSRLRGGEVLMTIVGSVGNVAVAPPALAGWNVARAVAVIPVRAGLPARWVAWCLRSPEVRHHLDARLNTTVQKTLNLRDLAALEIPMPPREDIAAIARVLGALDDKIESNESAASLCHAALSTLYRGWFVDGVALPETNGGQHGPPPAGSLCGVATVTYGAPFKSEFFGDEGVPLLRIRDLGKDEPGVRTAEQRPGARLIRPKDVVVGMDGEFRAHVWHGPDAWLNQRVCAFDPRPGVSRAFLFEAIKNPLAFFEATKDGTTVIHLGKKDIDTFKVPAPNADTMRAFAQVADPLLELAVGLRVEARHLVNVRDELLPRLLTGRLTVAGGGDLESVAEKLLAEAAA